MLKIRLRRVGRKNEPHYQIVVTPHTNPVKSNYLVKVGWFNPKTKEVKVDAAQVLEWLNKGAQPSNRVAKLLTEQNIKHPSIKYVPKTPKAPKKGKKDASAKKPAPVVAEQAAEATTEEVTPAVEGGAAKPEEKPATKEEAKEEVKSKAVENDNQSGEQPTKDNEEVS